MNRINTVWRTNKRLIYALAIGLLALNSVQWTQPLVSSIMAYSMLGISVATIVGIVAGMAAYEIWKVTV